MTKKEFHKSSLTPSKLMRLNRPEYYSDSTSTQAYRLSRPVLSHHLSTLTERNQHTPFETLCRALSQREICPNLRPQTGPEGGGDGKVDTETYPVADEISERWHEGLTNGGKERWAFAFSAKKRWPEKLRKDVKNIIETKREYSHIHFFTNQNPRAAVRLRIEQELTDKYNVRVTIYDRNWIEEKIINNHHEDLAHEILGVGDYDANKIIKGPKDTYREAELNEIETAFTQQDKSGVINFDSVSEALRVAKLSRGLERPRNETDGRFARAIRLAKKYGTERQHLVANYEHAWTCFWWFDDIDTVNELYNKVESLALTSQATADLEKLSNLYHVLVGWVRQQPGHDASSLRLKERSSALVSRLRVIASDTSSPNNALYAESLLTLHGLSDLEQENQSNKFDETWRQFIGIVDRAEGLAEFPAELVDKLITTISQFAPDSEILDELVLKLADFMGDRKKDGKQGEIFFLRGSQKLDAGKPIEAVTWFGKATVAFSKEEYQERLVETIHELTVAYYVAGLFWAGRTTALSCLTTLFSMTDEEGRIQDRLLPVLKIYILTCLRLGHLPDLLHAVFVLQNLRGQISLSEEYEQRLENELLEFDQLLSCSMMALEQSELCKLSELPPILDYLQLFNARTVLLYRLGYQAELRSDGSFPDDMTDHQVIELMQLVQSQPATEDLPRSIILNHSQQPFQAVTKVLGTYVRFSCDSEFSQILICEILISSLEGFAATMLNRRVYPCTSKADVLITTGGKKTEIKIDKYTFTIRVSWPRKLSLSDPSHSESVQKAVIEFVANTIDLITSSQNLGLLLDELVNHEKVFERCSMFGNTVIFHNRVFGASISKLSDFPVASIKNYPLKDKAPIIEPVTPPNRPKQKEVTSLSVQSHTDISVTSIVNPYLWDDAEWSGTGYFIVNPNYPPVLGLQFRNSELGFKIFEQLKERLGPVDKDELIRVAIVKGVNCAKPLHYRVHITTNRVAYKEQSREDNLTVFVSRFNLMEAETHDNIDLLMNHYEHFNAFFFAPVYQTTNGPRPELNLSLIKREVYVTDAWKIGKQHDDSPAVLPSDDVVVPKNIKNPPVYELLDKYKSRC